MLIFLGASDEAVIAKTPRWRNNERTFQPRMRADFEWRNFRREGSSSERVARPRRFFPLYVKRDQVFGSQIAVGRIQARLLC